MKQIVFPEDKINPPSHGGKRRGAGRKSKVGEQRHAARPDLQSRHPLHITVRLRNDLPSLRKRRTLKRLQHFMWQVQKFGLRINHFSVLRNHIHMIAEVDDTKALQRGMMSFNGRLGRWLRAQGVKAERFPRGLFKGRYHIQILKSPRQMKNALKYVLLNASKHFRKCPYIDQFSSGAYFTKWQELLREKFFGFIQAQVMSLQSAQKNMKAIQEDFGRTDNWEMPEIKEGMAANSWLSATAPPAGLVPSTSWLARVGWQRG